MSSVPAKINIIHSSFAPTTLGENSTHSRVPDASDQSSPSQTLSSPGVSEQRQIPFFSVLLWYAKCDIPNTPQVIDPKFLLSVSQPFCCSMFCQLFLALLIVGTEGPHHSWCWWISCDGAARIQNQAEICATGCQIKVYHGHWTSKAKPQSITTLCKAHSC